MNGLLRIVWPLLQARAVTMLTGMLKEVGEKNGLKLTEREYTLIAGFVVSLIGELLSREFTPEQEQMIAKVVGQLMDPSRG